MQFVTQALTELSSDCLLMLTACLIPCLPPDTLPRQNGKCGDGSMHHHPLPEEVTVQLHHHVAGSYYILQLLCQSYLWFLSDMVNVDYVMTQRYAKHLHQAFSLSTQP